MPLLDIAAVPPGSVLSAPVTDARGNVLVGEGRVLTEEWLQRLKARGVARVQVQAASGQAVASAVPAGPAEDLLKRLDAMFARAPQDPVMQALAAAARQVVSGRKA